MTDYFPLVEGWVLEYLLKDAMGEGILRSAYRKVSHRGPSSRASVEQTIQRGEDAPESFVYVARKSSARVWTSAWGVEIMLPPKVGRKWRRDQSDFVVDSVTSRKLVPAGDFKDCLEVSFLVGAGDGGGGRRFYAPGVGLIYAMSTDETDPYELALRRVVREPSRAGKVPAR